MDENLKPIEGILLDQDGNQIGPGPTADAQPHGRTGGGAQFRFGPHHLHTFSRTFSGPMAIILPVVLVLGFVALAFVLAFLIGIWLVKTALSLVFSILGIFIPPLRRRISPRSTVVIRGWR